jgi:hypothetical protein
MSESFESITKSINTNVSSVLDKVEGNKYLSAALVLFLILYAGIAAPKLPRAVESLFDNVIVKLIIIFLIVFASGYSPTVAIATAVAFLVTLWAIDRARVDRFVSMSKRHRERFEADYDEAINLQAPVLPNVSVPSQEELLPTPYAPIPSPMQTSETTQKTSENIPSTVEESKSDTIIPQDHYRFNHELRPDEQVVQHEAYRWNSPCCNGKCNETGQSCVVCANYRNSFYPQYVNNNDFAYESRDMYCNVKGYDPYSRVQTTQNRGGLRNQFNN